MSHSLPRCTLQHWHLLELPAGLPRHRSMLPAGTHPAPGRMEGWAEEQVCCLTCRAL